TLEYVDVIKKCNPHFRPECMFIPKRTLTYPRQPAKNHGHDNIQDDYILRVHEPLGNKYIILDLMGQGTFGQVVKCKATKTGEYVAIKVIKRQHAFFMQGLKEIEILKKLKQKQDEHHRFLQLIHSFEFRGHLCVVFELLSISLQALFRQQPVRPRLSIHDIQQIAIPLLETLARLKEMRIIHTDLKPDNILLKDPDRLHDVKLIDYGSALFETDSPHYHIQTAFYRSPEVILQDAFGCAIDMWSFGCFVAELWIGKPLFPSGHEATLIHMMVATLKQLPPAHMLHRAKRSSEFFD
ncbi:kinase-like domain-containing protein, partial [Gilbertella persicaria]|uniref:kinase-like domain-containing protein n=1 Tax=Gilbertella persicaria TaxID=101096 RepID=UPI00221EFB73